MLYKCIISFDTIINNSNTSIQVHHLKKNSKINILKKNAREPEAVVVDTSNKDGASIAVTGVIYQHTDPELGQVQDLEDYRQKERV